MVAGKSRNRPTSGCLQNPHNSSGVAPPAIAYPFKDPTDAPTIKSGSEPVFDATPRHTPACHAPNIPPPEKTSARFIEFPSFCANPPRVSYNRNETLKWHLIRRNTDPTWLAFWHWTGMANV